MVEVGELVRRLGGTGNVARANDVSASAVSQWIADGRIPAAREIAMWRMARDAGIDWAPPSAEGLALIPKDAA